VIFCASTATAHADFHVSPKGKDSNAGTKRGPFETLERARDAVRDLKQTSGLPAGGVTVWIHKGDYALTRSFALTNLDSGEPGRPIVYRVPAGEKVRLLGGRALPQQAFQPVTTPDVLARLDAVTRGKVLMANLAALGITNLGARGAPDIAANKERSPGSLPPGPLAHSAGSKFTD
jgi:hypothetical protein